MMAKEVDCWRITNGVKHNAVLRRNENDAVHHVVGFLRLFRGTTRAIDLDNKGYNCFKSIDDLDRRIILIHRKITPKE
jgi:hypothetical protein